MRCVIFDPTSLTDEKKIWWDSWLVRAEIATEKIVEAWETSGSLKPVNFKSDIWKELKYWLLDNVFHGKCAYCETDIGRARMFGGDAEHFRPKSSVRNLVSGKYVVSRAKLPDGQSIEHPGYFWLAYLWQNLMPTCKECNSGDGKCDKLPVAIDNLFLLAESVDPSGRKSARFQGYCYPVPSVLDILEAPLVCRPHWNCGGDCYVDRQMKFGWGGVVAGVTEAGRTTIEILKLDSKELMQARDREIRRATTKFLQRKAAAIEDGMSPDEASAIAALSVRDWTAGKLPYSAAVTQVMREEKHIN